jgi:diguanylate cyclase (GGDEF)-like protein/PAS domain S-box-containing protein
MNIQDQRRQIVTRAVIAAVMTGIIVAVAVSVPLINETHRLTGQLATNVANTKTESIRTILDQHQDLARQTASRSELARMLGEYVQGRTTLTELQTFTYPRLRDGARDIDHLAAIVRYDSAGNEVARIGSLAERLPEDIPLPANLDIREYALQNGTSSQPLLHTIGTIQTNGQTVGYDLLMFKPAPFQRVFENTDNFVVCMLDKPRTKRLALNEHSHQVALTKPVGCLHSSDNLQEGRSGDYQLAEEVDGTQVMSFLRPLEGYDWEVHIRSESSQVFSGVFREAMIAIFIIIGLSGVSGLLVKRALKPLVHTLSNQAEKIARSSEELRLAYQVFEHTHEMVVISDLSLNIIRANPAFIDVTGLPGRKVVHKKVTDFLVSEMAEQEIVDWLQTQLATEKMWQGEVWLQTAKGRATPFLVTVSPVTDRLGATQQYVLTFTDITERVKSETRIRRLAHCDELTGLPNRAALEQHLRQVIDQCHTTGTRFAVLFLDLDKFKPVNDIYGHQAGDEILVNVAKRLTNCLREGDFVGRRGGDEFQIITGPLRRPEDARPIAEKVVAVLNETFEVKGHIVDVGASVGVALYPDDGVTAMDLVNSADAAMYQVKASGRNAVGFA